MNRFEILLDMKITSFFFFLSFFFLFVFALCMACAQKINQHWCSGSLSLFQFSCNVASGSEYPTPFSATRPVIVVITLFSWFHRIISEIFFSAGPSRHCATFINTPLFLRIIGWKSLALFFFFFFFSPH